MLPLYLAKVRSFGISRWKCKRKCNMHWFLKAHICSTILVHLPYLLTCCFNYRFLLNIFCKQRTILSKQLLWTEAAFSACLAWDWQDHHWQCNWRVAWTSSRMCACRRKENTSSNYCDNIQPYDKRRFSFCQMWQDF